ncbi:hypothetical protein XENOCAPTIV_003631 [Xenoophorus captivus]|uniref:Uncharacterized protein n=1 Tax=Xenoophorus captivus TaxID=1517983 RepID=A0ABV0R4E4_9TELE
MLGAFGNASPRPASLENTWESAGDLDDMMSVRDSNSEFQTLEQEVRNRGLCPQVWRSTTFLELSFGEVQSLQVVPDQLFGAEAERTLEHWWQFSLALEVWGGRSRGMGPPTQHPRKQGARDPWGQFWDTASEVGKLAVPSASTATVFSATGAFQESDQLFICHDGKKVQALSEHSLSHWMINAISLTYRSVGAVAPSSVVCLSTRSVTTWAAIRPTRVVLLGNICAAASWATTC